MKSAKGAINAPCNHSRAVRAGGKGVGTGSGDSNTVMSPKHIDAAITNICRCGTYPRVRQAIHAAANALTKREAA